MADHQVANVGDEAEGLAYDEDGVVANDAVGHDAERAYKGKNPEEWGKFRFPFSGGVPILVDETECEDDLTCRAEEEQP